MALLLALAASSAGAASTPRTFTSPEAAAEALARAARTDDENGLRELLGAEGSRLLRSGDAVADAQGREKFSKAYDELSRLESHGDKQVTLVVGEDEWPLPIPLVREGARWHFDAAAGELEILKRRIGRNELAAMQVCRAIVDAQREFAAQHLDSAGVPTYASRLVSRPGRRDGLYWPTATGEPPSPLGSLLAQAADEGYPDEGARALQPYHGYYYRILTRQGKAAPGGARDYRIKGSLIGGFAVLAYPARYGASGVMTFLVGPGGEIYQKDLGADTKAAAEALAKFDPDASWQREKPPQAP